MNPEEAVRAHLDLGARVSIGMHFGTFQLTDEGDRRAGRARWSVRALRRTASRGRVQRARFRRERYDRLAVAGRTATALLSPARASSAAATRARPSRILSVSPP